MSTIKVIIVDDHTLFRQGVCSLLNDQEDIEIVASLGGAKDALEKLKIIKNVDVILVDIHMPDMDGIEFTYQVREKYPQTQIIFLTIELSELMVKKAIAAGAISYLPKEVEKESLLKAIIMASNGEEYIDPLVSRLIYNHYIVDRSNKGIFKHGKHEILTEREIEVLVLIAEGLSNREIGERLFISSRTVDSHRSNIQEKLKIRSTAELVKYSIKEGFTILD